MRPFIYVIIGILLGVMCAFITTYLFILIFPAISGKGGDAMSQGILGTLLLVFIAPVFSVVGGMMGYNKSKKEIE